MKFLPPISLVICAALALQSCASFTDDHFAHDIQTGNTRRAVATMEPAQARLHIFERNGRWFYPIHYTIARGDSEATFALIRRGSPTRLDGKSLAYNAARAGHSRMADELASAGYGDRADISQAIAENHRERESSTAVAGALALGVVTLLAMGLGSSSSSGDDWEVNEGRRIASMQQANRQAAAQGQPLPNPGVSP